MKNKPLAKQADEIERRWSRAASTVMAATRRHKDVAQQDLADKLGWTRNMVANLESGRRSVHFSDLILFAKALDVEPEQLVARIMQWESEG
jgi:transcriptional regulator with XRE-family HTH domain